MIDRKTELNRWTTIDPKTGSRRLDAEVLFRGDPPPTPREIEEDRKREEREKRIIKAREERLNSWQVDPQTRRLISETL